MARYATHVSARATPQTEPMFGKNQVKNSAGGFVFDVNDWTRLDRFLILGNEGGSYYASEQKMTVENAQAILRCIKEDGTRVIQKIAEISKSGRAPKNDPAIFALAMCMAHGSEKTKNLVKVYLSDICRIGTHLFHFVDAVQEMRGWGRAFAGAVRDWYQDKDLADLEYQMVKYQSRDKWSHRDLIRLAHPKPNDNDRSELFKWAVKGESPKESEVLQKVDAFERAKAATDAKEICKLIRDFDLPRECIPTQFLNEPKVWEALLEKMPMTAMVRNLGNLTKHGILAPMSNGTAKVLAELANVDRIKKSRLHPLALLIALKTYEQGRGDKGSSTWTPVTQIVDALDGAFYTAFANVEPTGKRWYLGCDVSGSMYSSYISGCRQVSCGFGAAAMALVTSRVEKQCVMAAFDTTMHPFTISPRTRLDTVAREMAALPWGGTDCALPMRDALERKIPVDAFVVYTDSETWAGGQHPIQALDQYRRGMGIPAKLIVVGMVGNKFSIADPDDGGMMDVVGFDANCPAIMADFVR